MNGTEADLGLFRAADVRVASESRGFVEVPAACEGIAPIIEGSEAV